MSCRAADAPLDQILAYLPTAPFANKGGIISVDKAVRIDVFSGVIRDVYLRVVALGNN